MLLDLLPMFSEGTLDGDSSYGVGGPSNPPDSWFQIERKRKLREDDEMMVML